MKVGCEAVDSVDCVCNVRRTGGFILDMTSISTNLVQTREFPWLESWSNISSPSLTTLCTYCTKETLQTKQATHALYNCLGDYMHRTHADTASHADKSGGQEVPHFWLQFGSKFSFMNRLYPLVMRPRPTVTQAPTDVILRPRRKMGHRRGLIFQSYHQPAIFSGFAAFHTNIGVARLNWGSCKWQLSGMTAIFCLKMLKNHKMWVQESLFKKQKIGN